jgi:hypothetical protein
MNDLDNVDLFSFIDDSVKEFYGINEEEYVFILDNATDEEIDILCECIISEEDIKDQGFQIVKKYIKK